MAQINEKATQDAVPQKKFWPVIGKAWITAKGGVNCVIGVRRGGVEQVQSVTLNLGDRLYFRPNKKRPDKKDADYQICIPE